MMVNGWTVEGVTPSPYGATWFVVDSPEEAAGFVLAMSRLGYVVTGEVLSPDAGRVCGECGAEASHVTSRLYSRAWWCASHVPGDGVRIYYPEHVPMTQAWLADVERHCLGCDQDSDRDAVHREAAIAAQWADAHSDADIHHEGYGVAVYTPGGGS